MLDIQYIFKLIVTYYMCLTGDYFKKRKTNIYWATTMCQVDITKLQLRLKKFYVHAETHVISFPRMLVY